MTPRIWAERWTRSHALLLLVTALGCVALRQAWPAAAVGALSLAFALGVELRGRGFAAGLGAANAITALRIALVVLLAFWLERAPGPREAVLVLVVFALDGLDGWLARRSGTASEFGARFDMEGDALLVLACALGLYARGRLGGFILVPGLLRYVYVLALAAWPRLGAEAPRSSFGRYAFGLMVLSFAASAWPLSRLHAPLAAVAALGIALSFGRSVYWSLRTR